jgi:D-alanyl-D-alanine carboxypeptidase
MVHRTPAPPAHRAHRIRAAGVLVVVAALAAAGCQLLAAPSSTAASPFDAPSPSSTPAPVPTLRGEQLGRPGGVPDIVRPEHRGALGEADGVVPDGTTVFDEDVPAVANLDPALLAVLRRAATAAAGARVTFLVSTGWRSVAYQEALLQEAISKYGSVEEAARWVATPATSAHVSGDAVDLEPAKATTWLSRHGAAYGLCQIYRNEPWHYELRPDAPDHGCPAMYADPTHDPRMQQ